MTAAPEPMRVARPASLEALPDVVAAWALRGAGPVVVLVGGAGALDGDARGPVARAVADEVMPALEAVGGVLLTGGTDAGVMRLAGDARRDGGGRFPLVGVAPAALVAVPGPDGVARSGRAGQRVQPDHTHLLAVPGDRWGAETPWLFALAREVADGLPAVTVALNGGPVARQEIAESVRLGIPVVVVAGTGRLADQVAAALAGVDAHPGARLAADQDPTIVGSGLVSAVRSDEDGALRAVLEDALAVRHQGVPMTPSVEAPDAPTATSYEEEMRQLIERMGITDEQRRFLRARWLDQVTYMGARAAESKRRYHAFRLTTVIGGVIVPALVSISLAGAGRFDPGLDLTMRLVTFVVSALVAVTASVEGLLHFGDRWRHYRVNAELLKSEGWQYLTGSGGYRRLTSPDHAFQAFATRVEDILRDDVDGFMSDVVRSDASEKIDIFTRL